MTIAYQQSPTEDAQIKLANRYRQARKMASPWIMLPVLLSILFGLSLFAPRIVPFWSVGLPATVVVGLLRYWIGPRFLQQEVTEGGQAAVTPTSVEMSVSLLEDGVEIERDASSTKARWSFISDIIVTRSFVEFRCDTGSNTGVAVAIPIRVFEHESELTAFIHEATRLWQIGRSAETRTKVSTVGEVALEQVPTHNLPYFRMTDDEIQIAGLPDPEELKTLLVEKWNTQSKTRGDVLVNRMGIWAWRLSHVIVATGLMVVLVVALAGRWSPLATKVLCVTFLFGIVAWLHEHSRKQASVAPPPSAIELSLPESFTTVPIVCRMTAREFSIRDSTGVSSRSWTEIRSLERHRLGILIFNEYLAAYFLSCRWLPDEQSQEALFVRIHQWHRQAVETRGRRSEVG